MPNISYQEIIRKCFILWWYIDIIFHRSSEYVRIAFHILAQWKCSFNYQHSNSADRAQLSIINSRPDGSECVSDRDSLYPYSRFVCTSTKFYLESADNTQQTTNTFSAKQLIHFCVYLSFDSAPTVHAIHFLNPSYYFSFISQFED